MYLYQQAVIALINVAVLLLVNGCDICSRPPNSTQSNFGNSQDEECKKIIKVINRSNISVKPLVDVSPLPETSPTPEISAENTNKDNLPKPQRFNSRKATGKTAQELQKETDEKAKQEQAKKWDEQAKQWDKKAKQEHDRLLKNLDARIEGVQAVELSDSQLKNLQTQLVQAYQQERQATNAMFTPYRDSSSQIEQSTSSSLRKPQEDLQTMQQQLDKQMQQLNKQIQQMNDASSKVQTANSALNKYCGLE